MRIVNFFYFFSATTSQSVIIKIYNRTQIYLSSMITICVSSSTTSSMSYKKNLIFQDNYRSMK